MRGRVVSFDVQAGEGEIVGEDGVHYRFATADLNSLATAALGRRVDFRAEDGHARNISMASGGGETAPGHFDMGRVIRRTFTSIGKNWAVFFGSAVVLVGVPSIAMAWVLPNLMTQWGVATPLAMGVLYLCAGVLALVGLYVMQGVVMKAAIDGFSGKPGNIPSAISVGFSRFMPLLGLAILMALGLMLGFLLFIVPGLILAVMWSVAAPAVVAERRGVFDSFQRSVDLTEGHRWAVFGLGVIYWIMSAIIALVIQRIGLAMGGEGPWVDSSLEAVADVISGVFGAAGAASLYFELRSGKEGVGAEALAAVFD